MPNPLGVLGYEGGLALRYLAGARGQGTFSLLTVLALLGTLIGVGSLVVGQAITQGIQVQARDALVRREPHLWVLPDLEALEDDGTGQDVSTLGLGAEDLAVLGLSGTIQTAPPVRPWFDFDMGLLTQLDQVAGLQSARPSLSVDVFLNRQGRYSLTSLRGVTLGELLDRGALLDSAPQALDWALVVPNELLWSGDIFLGQRLTLITTQMEPTPVGRLPLTQDFEVVATYPGSASDPLLTTLATNQLLLNADGKISGLEVYVQDPFALAPARAVLDTLRGPVLVQDWQERRGSVAAFLGVLRLVMVVILGLILLVAAFNIFASQLMLTDAQRQAIALMRATGFGRGSILRIFLFAGLFIGLTGATLGVLAGLAVTWNFPFLIQIGVPGLSFFANSPPIIFAADVALAFFLALGMTLIAALLPAWSAASIPPVEAFSYG